VTEYEIYMKRVKSREQHGDQIRTAVKDINSLKTELREIKSLIKELINGS
jgi:flagellar hook-associated protein FlgK